MNTKNNTPQPAANPTPVGILLANTGTPNAPTPSAVRQFLAQFLSDRRVINYPRWFWLPLLYGIILTFRPRRSARLYQRIWTANGSPLLHYSQKLAEGVEKSLNRKQPNSAIVKTGMRYGSPSIVQALREFKALGVRKIVLLPLFPQYSGSTTGSILDAFHAELQKWPTIPSTETIASYHDHPAYIQALAASVSASWEQHGKPDHTLFSYHGIPKSYVEMGDPYQRQCLETSHLLAGELKLSEENKSVSFQSRFGPQEWLQPYTNETIPNLAAKKFNRLDVVCPGFAVDCLETIDEIGHEGRLLYQETGGGAFTYLPALNDSPLHVQALVEILNPTL